MELGIVLITTNGNEQTATCFYPPECSLRTLNQVISFFPTVRFKEVASDNLVTKVCQFLNEWDTHTLSPLEITQESRFWRHFFCSERMGLSGLRRMDFYRFNSEKKYSIYIVGRSAGRISKMFSKIYGVPPEKLTEALAEEVFRASSLKRVNLFTNAPEGIIQQTFEAKN